LVFDVPVPSHLRCQHVGRLVAAGDVRPPLARRHATARTLRLNQDQGPKLWPRLRARQPRHLALHPYSSNLVPTVPLVRSLDVAPRVSRQTRKRRVVERLEHLLVEARLIRLQAEYVVCTFVNDRLRDPSLAAYRVDRDRRAAKRQELEELRDGGDLVRLHVGRKLTEHHLVLADPRVDHVQRALAVGRFHRAPDALAVDRDLLARERLAQRVRPRRQRATERGGLHGRHHAPQRVCARDPTREHEHLSELRLTLLAKVSDVVPSLATRDRAEQHQNEHIRQPMAPRTLHPRVRYLVEQRAEIRPSHALLSARCGRDGKPFETFPRPSIPQSENKPTQPVLSEDAPALGGAGRSLRSPGRRSRGGGRGGSSRWRG